MSGSSLDLYESELGKVLHLTAEQLQHVFHTKDLQQDAPHGHKEQAAGPMSVSLPPAQPAGGHICSCKHADQGDMDGISTSSRCICEAELVGESYALMGDGMVVWRAGKVRIITLRHVLGSEALWRMY